MQNEALHSEHEVVLKHFVAPNQLCSFILCFYVIHTKNANFRWIAERDFRKKEFTGYDKLHASCCNGMWLALSKHAEIINSLLRQKSCVKRFRVSLF